MAAACRFEELEKEKRAAVKSIDEEAAKKKKEAEEGKEKNLLIVRRRERESRSALCLKTVFSEGCTVCSAAPVEPGVTFWWRAACSGDVVFQVFRELGPSKASPHIPRRADRSSSETVLGTSTVLEMKFLRCRYCIPRQIQAYMKPFIPVRCVEMQC